MKGISNWHLALSEHLPEQIAGLRATVEELDRQKADHLSLIQDYEQMLTIAHRRVAVPGVLTLVPNVTPSEEMFL